MVLKLDIKPWWLAIPLAWALAACGCQLSPPSNPVHLAVQEIDLGHVYMGQEARGSVRVENRSDQTVNLENYQSSCGCLEWQIDPPASLAPRQSLELGFSLHSQGLRGDLHKEAMFSAQGFKGITRLKVRCQSIPAADFPILHDFGKIPAGLHSCEIEIKPSATGEPVKLDKVRSSHPDLKIRQILPARFPAGAGARLIVDLQASPTTPPEIKVIFTLSAPIVVEYAIPVLYQLSDS